MVVEGMGHSSGDRVYVTIRYKCQVGRESSARNSYYINYISPFLWGLWMGELEKTKKNDSRMCVRVSMGSNFVKAKKSFLKCCSLLPFHFICTCLVFHKLNGNSSSEKNFQIHRNCCFQFSEMISESLPFWIHFVCIFQPH